MLTLVFVEPVMLVTIHGKPLSENGSEVSPEKAVHMTDFQFLADRTLEPGFAGDRKGYEQIRFTRAVQKSLEAQREIAEQRGYWDLEDEHYHAFKRHLESAPLNQGMLHCIEPFLTRFFEPVA